MHRVRDETEIYTNYLLSEFEELNNITGLYTGKKVDVKMIDDIMEYLIFMYLNGMQSVGYMVGASEIKEPDSKTISDALYQKIDGKDVMERLEQYLEFEYMDFYDNIDSIIRTDGHRMYILGQMAMIDQLSSEGYTIKKTWDTTLDGKERETHRLLDGKTKYNDEYFETVNGKAKAPGQFGVPEEDCNCRCILKCERI